MNGFPASPDELNWLRDIYFVGEHLRMAIVVIHQLPETEATLWLRILGRGRVQERVITELSALSVDHPIRSIALELLYQVQSRLAVNQQQLEVEDREFVMAIAPLFQQKLEAVKQEGRQEGRQEGQRSILESFFIVRFGELDAVLAAFLTPVSALPATEFTMLFLQLSTLTVDEQGMQQARQLLAENVLRMRFGELGDTADATLRVLVTGV